MVNSGSIREKKFAEGSREALLVESPLLRLPEEIRLMIWEQVFGGYHIYAYPRRNSTRISIEFRSEDTTESWSTISAKRRQGPILILATVCRQFYMETALLPFTLNPWHMDCEYLKDFPSYNENCHVRARELTTLVVSYDDTNDIFIDGNNFPNLRTILLCYWGLQRPWFYQNSKKPHFMPLSFGNWVFEKEMLKFTRVKRGDQ
ncbi:hypothetical protein COCC4DRAFT_151951 [Bipolaris maydis ATCC 48331]|uniref:DUF7730 domain-containing protein n=2 Tax=Cochliobolus heterostrophus TaxID=5016 RepID=M2UJG4_COCH5|nr:uncharacterized protein COCC4DRAFT_151951 [Bipolaris maydis ATCC 48331]EMD93791.1 hypothetical protein COCHEDRAFT_1212470 [Bipolaris maydis C5]KAJ5028069.1 hypothetical protein J3E73DRAFT_185629 [Bipolaris maydis]ENH99915.1 hypothetical protein COCC4DRAFT_151951 [Bipolaris maydis ATCC 48331]KAJ6203567.1 hypothetical protein PSV09DRAFT_1212470 [Bipolaris maydis]KAJ6265315.1 hypothetical protein PSV08DRAFT_357327 [Bipolaris maydis]